MRERERETHTERARQKCKLTFTYPVVSDHERHALGAQIVVAAVNAAVSWQAVTLAKAATAAQSVRRVASVTAPPVGAIDLQRREFQSAKRKG